MTEGTVGAWPNTVKSVVRETRAGSCGSCDVIAAPANH